ncbi:ribosome recycling factor [Arachnia propionica]|uniref:Ribosome-recycling factor n=1 Tax=Arachnia propionica TaxID=1750 RepID=A0AB37HYS8_9ACTN|nr:ribosome recycling factor [Arachnia propionica]QCT39319.1 ribosome recycling factor [Arachnia propionica]QUC12690.1 ribosome recycling factor [Arachnia propionica]QUC15626.1 ribosome recycling factor [Arachnia propionica]RPA19281.1 ribosome recycling factor [Arachnia propionica]
MADVEKETQSRMQQAVDHAREDLSTIRTGRAHPAMFNRLNADYYGAPTPLQQLATFNSPDPRTMLITPFDRSAIAAIEKVIREADLGVNPSNDGNSIRVVMPQLTEERRKEYIKLARAKAEDARIAVRNIRRHSIDALKKLEKKSEISEDELVRAEKAMDVTTRKYVEAIDELLKNKEAELSEV